MRKVIYLLLILTTSCIEEYVMPDYTTNDFHPELVIQGYILSGEESVIYLSQTEPVYSTASTIPITNAKVKIIGQNGYKSELAEYNVEENNYVLQPDTLPSNTLYAIQIEWNGEVYQSDFSEIIDSPDINEVTYKETEGGISIHSTTYADPAESRYYMWGYEEDWEFHAELDLLIPTSGVFIYNKNKYPFENPKTNPYYYCWSHRNSSDINIYSTANLQENTIKDKELLKISADDIRISYIYSILVKQWSLTQEAYIYFQTLEKMSESSGGLFQMMPSDLRGNVSCISNPDIKVRGYITSASVKTKRLFVYASDFETVIPAYSNCSLTLPPIPTYAGWQLAWKDYVNYWGAVVFTETGEINKSSVLYANTCVDCTQTKGATKKRPDFWPNDHE